MREFIRVASTDDVKPGNGMVVEMNDKALALFNIDGTIYAIDNTCVHRGGPLGEGDLEGDTVSCPWHGWQYNVKTGACVNNPAAKIETYQVKVEGTDIKVLL
jgi:NAD(P)H-dependent nitrite reductase small subunit